MIGWYVHDHGSGHRRRLEAVAAHLRTPVTGMGSGPPAAGVDWLPLPTDDSRVAGFDPTAGGALHWAPLGEPGLLGRATLLAGWVRDTGCRLIVVDVSVEMLLLARLLGLPTVAVLQPGRRTDRAHRLGYDSASALLAPWPQAAEPGRLLGGSPRRSDRTTWTSAFSRHDAQDVHARPSRDGYPVDVSRAPVAPGGGCPPGRCVALVLGHGGHQVRAADVRSAADATPGWHWHVAGALSGADAVAHPSVTAHGTLADVGPLLRHADVVTGPCGGGLVAEVAAAGTPYLALPQPRPFDEQDALAGMLRRLGCADVARRWPTPRAWPLLLDRLQQRSASAPQRWRRWSDGDGAARAARMIEDTLAGVVDRRPEPAR